MCGAVDLPPMFPHLLPLYNNGDLGHFAGIPVLLCHSNQGLQKLEAEKWATLLKDCYVLLAHKELHWGSCTPCLRQSWKRLHGSLIFPDIYRDTLPSSQHRCIHTFAYGDHSILVHLNLWQPASANFIQYSSSRSTLFILGAGAGPHETADHFPYLL